MMFLSQSNFEPAVSFHHRNPVEHTPCDNGYECQDGEENCIFHNRAQWPEKLDDRRRVKRSVAENLKRGKQVENGVVGQFEKTVVV